MVLAVLSQDWALTTRSLEGRGRQFADSQRLRA